MPSPLASAHIEGQRRLRVTIMQAITNIWNGLAGYDEADVPGWLEQVVPVVEAGQRSASALTDGFLAEEMDRKPFGLSVLGPELRNGTSPEEVYRRPFVNLWQKLGEGVPFNDAKNAALARAKSSGAMDMQLAMRATANAVERADPKMFGFRRAADPGACEFCRLLDGAYVKRADAMPMHNHCGCGLEPNTERHPLAANLPDGVAIREHGELGPVLVDPAHDFTSESDLPDEAREDETAEAIRKAEADLKRAQEQSDAAFQKLMEGKSKTQAAATRAARKVEEAQATLDLLREDARIAAKDKVKGDDLNTSPEPEAEGFSVGDRAIVRRYGNDYEGEVVKVTKTKVHVRFTYANGQERTVAESHAEVKRPKGAGGGGEPQGEMTRVKMGDIEARVWDLGGTGVRQWAVDLGDGEIFYVEAKSAISAVRAAEEARRRKKSPPGDRL